MTVTPDDVRHIAALARLALTPAEVARFTTQLDAILGHVAELEAADTLDTPDAADGADAADAVDAADADRGDAAPVPPATEHRAPLADDVPGADPLQQAVAELTAAWQDGFFTVPRLAAMQGTDDAGADDAETGSA